MNKIPIFFIIVVAGLWITGLTLSIFRPELLEGILGNIIGIALSATIVFVVLGYLFTLIRDKKWSKVVLLILGVILFFMVRSGFLVDVIKAGLT
tara:strand:+ start:201 stop:482 length:282 start_codon:yes stop_codon:yes gene_type:complete